MSTNKVQKSIKIKKAEYWKNVSMSAFDKDLKKLGKCYFALKALYKKEPKDDNVTYEDIYDEVNDQQSLYDELYPPEEVISID